MHSRYEVHCQAQLEVFTQMLSENVSWASGLCNTQLECFRGFFCHDVQMSPEQESLSPQPQFQLYSYCLIDLTEVTKHRLYAVCQRW